MRLDDYPSNAVDTMLEHRYGSLGSDAGRPITPQASSAKAYATSPDRKSQMKSASAAMLEHRYGVLY